MVGRGQHQKHTDADNKQCVSIGKSLNYVEDLDKALAAKKITKETRVVGKKSYKAAEQNCSTCLFFDHKKEGKPTCQLIPKCLVHDIGSCNSWSPKA